MPIQYAYPTESLESLCEINIGKTPSRANPSFWKGDSSWLSIADMNQGRILDRTKEKITKDGIKASGIKLVSKGTLLLSYKLSIGKVGITARPMFTNEAIAALPIIDPDRLDIDYLYWALNTIDLIENSDKAAMGKTLNKAKLKQIQIPLPPLAEQKRIAAILDAADALRAKRRQTIAELDALIQSTFLDLFGDPVTNPKGWNESTVGEVTTCIVPGRDKPKSFTGSIPWVTTNDLIEKGFTFQSKANIGLTSAEIQKVKAKIIPTNSVIMSCVGDLGICSITGRDLVMNQQLHAYLCGSSLIPEFLTYCLPFRKNWMIARATKTTLPYLNKTNCNSIPTVTPPLPLQQRFATIVETIEAQKARHRAHLAELDALFASLQHRAFSGGL